MKTRIFSVIFLFCLSYQSTISQSGGWSWVHPKPQGGYIQNIKMVDANNWFGMCDYGVMIKTTNAGATWSAFSIGYQSTLYPGSGIYTNLFSGWFFDANNFLLGTQSSRGIVRSTNGGATFDTIQVLTTGSGSVYDFHFINAQTGYFCGTSTYKLQKTTNAGLNWSQVPNLGTTTLYSVYASDTNNIIVTSTSGNTYFTTNAGVNWTTSNIGTTNSILDSKWINATTGYITGTGGCFRYTTNFGANWQGTSAPTAVTLNRIIVSGSDIYMGGFAADMYKSTDNGTTWNTLPFTASGQYSAFGIYGMDMVGTTMLIGGSYGLMNKSTNSGANWTTASYHKTVANMVDVYAQSGNGRIIAIGSLTGGPDNVIYSTNGGIDWTASSYVATDILSDLSMRNANTGYLCGRFGIFAKTTNGGANWDISMSGNSTLSAYFCNGVDFVDDNTGWIVGGVAGPGGNTKIFKTTNGGVNWTEQTSAYSGPIAVRVKMVNANTGYIAGSGQMQKTTDGGTTWTLIMTGLPNSTYNGLTVIDANNVFTTNSNAQAFTTSDGGANWVNMNFPLTNIGTLFCTDWVDANTGMVAGIFGTVGKTTDRGQSWTLSQTGGYTTMGIDMVHPDTAFAVCGNTVGGEVFKYIRSLTGNITWNNQVPSDYRLEQNYPNPFNPLTKINFAIPKAGYVSLKVFNITGEQVAVLVDRLNINAGSMSYDFNGSELASGVYFYSLIVNNILISTKKMVLVK